MHAGAESARRKDLGSCQSFTIHPCITHLCGRIAPSRFVKGYSGRLRHTRESLPVGKHARGEGEGEGVLKAARAGTLAGRVHHRYTCNTLFRGPHGSREGLCENTDLVVHAVNVARCPSQEKVDNINVSNMHNALLDVCRCCGGATLRVPHEQHLHAVSSVTRATLLYMM